MNTTLYTSEHKALCNKLEVIIAEQNPERESYRQLTYFLCTVGKKYFAEPEKRFLLVGRTINGWESDTYENLVEYIEDTPWKWLLDNNGKTHNRASFWRTAKNISSEIMKTENYDYLDHIAWSNLFKMSYKNGGNPLATDIKLQLDIAIELLAYEINTLRPRYILFCTDDYWTKEFLSFSKSDTVNDVKDVFSLLPNAVWSGWSNQNAGGDSAVLAVGALTWNDGFVTKLVISRRPERKPEAPYIGAVIKSFLCDR